MIPVIHTIRRVSDSQRAAFVVSKKTARTTALTVAGPNIAKGPRHAS